MSYKDYASYKEWVRHGSGPEFEWDRHRIVKTPIISLGHLTLVAALEDIAIYSRGLIFPWLEIGPESPSLQNQTVLVCGWVPMTSEEIETQRQDEALAESAYNDYCPDGGKCHHECAGSCARVSIAGPLSGVYPNDEWPAWIIQALSR